MTNEYWRGIKISEIKYISGVGGRFGNDDMDIHFEVTLKNDNKIRFQYKNRVAHEERNQLFDLYNEYNNIPETYLLENEMDIQVGGVSLPFGYRVENNKRNYEYKTLLEIERLTKEGKIRDEGWRHLVYICPLKIENGKIIHGKLTDAYREQLDYMGITYEE